MVFEPAAVSLAEGRETHAKHRVKGSSSALGCGPRSPLAIQCFS